MNDFMAELIPILFIIFNTLAAVFIAIGFKRGIIPNIIAAIFFAAALIWKIAFDFLDPMWLDYATVISNAFALFCDGIIIGVKMQGKHNRELSRFYHEEICNLMNLLHAKEENANLSSESDMKAN